MDEDNCPPNRLESIENRIKSMEVSLDRLVQDVKKRTKERDVGWLILGAVMGGLLSISVNLYTEYYMLAAAPTIDVGTFIGLSLGLLLVFGFLLWWAMKQIR